MSAAYDYTHNGYDPEGVDVTSEGVKVADALKMRKLACFTNASTVPIYLALKTSDDGVTCPAEAGKGIYLAANGGAYEINLSNLYGGEVWAIHADGASSHRLCVQQGS